LLCNQVRAKNNPWCRPHMARFTCSICSAPPEVLQAVNAALRAGESGRKMAARNGFSKSAIYGHREKCLDRTVLRRHQQTKRFTSKTVVSVQWPGDDVPKRDVVISVSYDAVDPADFKNPPEFWGAMEAEPAADGSLELPTPSPAEPEPPAAEPAQSKCQHYMVAVAAGVERCAQCGHQENAPAVFGVSRSRSEQQSCRDSLRSLGRFAR
jgi:hypothetical protein